MLGTTAVGLASVLPSCDGGERSVGVVVDVEDSGDGPPPTTAQGGRANSGRGGSSDGTSRCGMSQTATGGKSSSNGSGGKSGGSAGEGTADTGGGSSRETGGKDSGTGGKAEAAPQCGNGKREADEECDDGDAQDDDGCTTDCKYFCESCACEQCARTNCSNNGSIDPVTGEVVFVDYVEKCFEAEGSGMFGPALGIPKAELCSDIVSCVRSSGCAQEAEGQQLDAEWCYSGIPQAEWAPEKMNGKCEEQFLLGAETGDDADVQERWSDVSYALGAAVQLLICESEFCAAPCGLKVD